MSEESSSCHYPELVQYLDVDLPLPVAKLVAAHITECTYCSYQAQTQLVVQRLVKRVEFEPAPAGLQMRIMTKLTAVGYQ